jgi:di/tricarboxylate transporter
MLLTQPMHNAVVAVIMTPVAVKVAEALSSNSKAFAIAVIAGASASFLMPVGHPAPLLVKAPGNYTNGDYIKFGLVLNGAILAAIGLLAPFLWPL